MACLWIVGVPSVFPCTYVYVCECLKVCVWVKAAYVCVCRVHVCYACVCSSTYSKMRAFVLCVACV